MKATKLIALLQAAVAEHGDIEVVVQAPYEDTTCYEAATGPQVSQLYLHEDEGKYRPWKDFGRDDDGAGHEPVKVLIAD